jgi:hypothetical protein
MFAHLHRRETHPPAAARSAAKHWLAAALAAVYLRPAGINGLHPRCLRRHDPDPGPGRRLRGHPARARRPRGHRRRHGRLADHLDRARRRPGRSCRSGAPGSGAGRPPGHLRNHRMTRTPARPASPGSRPGARRGPSADPATTTPQPTTPSAAQRHRDGTVESAAETLRTGTGMQPPCFPVTFGGEATGQSCRNSRAGRSRRQGGRRRRRWLIARPSLGQRSERAVLMDGGWIPRARRARLPRWPDRRGPDLGGDNRVRRPRIRAYWVGHALS